MYFLTTPIAEAAPIQRTSLRCPACRLMGTFDPAGSRADIVCNQIGFGHRICPNAACKAYVLVIFEFTTAKVLESFPRQRLDFDAAGLPTEVLSSLSEAVDCHAAGCYRAALVMVRRTLEALCEDRGEIEGTLHTRLNQVKSKLMIASPLVDSLSDLKNLGNDATHIELKDFMAVGKDECELAIAITTEILKGVYQYEHLVKRLEAFKQAQQP